MPRKYEALFIFAGNVKEDALDKVVERSTAEIVKLGGTIEKTESFGRRSFVRTMQKHDHGVYVKVRFSIEPNQIDMIHTRFKHNEDTFRLQIVSRNERVEAAKALDDARRAAFKASVEATAPAAPNSRNYASSRAEEDSGRDA